MLTQRGEHHKWQVHGQFVKGERACYTRKWKTQSPSAKMSSCDPDVNLERTVQTTPLLLPESSLGAETNSIHGTSVSPIHLRLRFTCGFAFHDVKAPSLRRWLSACKGTCGATPGALYLACGFKVPANKDVPSSVGPGKTRICKWV